jgi:hypothetical protein
VVAFICNHSNKQYTHIGPDSSLFYHKSSGMIAFINTTDSIPAIPKLESWAELANAVVQVAGTQGSTLLVSQPASGHALQPLYPLHDFTACFHEIHLTFMPLLLLDFPVEYIQKSYMSPFIRKDFNTKYVKIICILHWTFFWSK